jgi:hypothetical protein
MSDFILALLKLVYLKSGQSILESAPHFSDVNIFVFLFCSLLSALFVFVLKKLFVFVLFQISRATYYFAHLLSGTPPRGNNNLSQKQIKQITELELAYRGGFLSNVDFEKRINEIRNVQ